MLVILYCLLPGLIGTRQSHACPVWKAKQICLTVTLEKSDFGHATVIRVYLGHGSGQGEVLPASAKMQAILKIPTPRDKGLVTRLIGLVSFCRKFCPNLSIIIAPWTGSQNQKVPFVWTQESEETLNRVKRVLTSPPLLIPADYGKEKVVRRHFWYGRQVRP